MLPQLKIALYLQIALICSLTCLVLSKQGLNSCQHSKLPTTKPVCDLLPGLGVLMSVCVHVRARMASVNSNFWWAYSAWETWKPLYFNSDLFSTEQTISNPTRGRVRRSHQLPPVVGRARAGVDGWECFWSGPFPFPINWKEPVKSHFREGKDMLSGLQHGGC
jgi:hypothetical protein